MDEKKLQNLLKEEKKRYWFCPQINGQCDHNCYCYIPPAIDRDGIDTIRDAFCIHLLHQEQPEISALCIH